MMANSGRFPTDPPPEDEGTMIVQEARRRKDTTMTKNRKRNPLGRGRSPRITPEAQAEVNVLQAMALKLGKLALEQNGHVHTDTLPLPGGVPLGKVEGADEDTEPLVLPVTVYVTVAPLSTAAIGVHPSHPTS